MASSKKNIGVIGLGLYLPKKVLTNADLEKMVDTSDEWIITRTGIKQRRLASADEATSDLAFAAACEALKDAQLAAKDIDMIIVATITPDMSFPSTSCLVQQKLKAENAVCFDISAACSGFVYGLSIAHSFISAGKYKTVLVIGAEKLSSIVDWTDRSTCVLFGDGAGAAIVSEVKTGGFLSFCLGADGNASDLLKLPAGGSRLPASHKTIDEHLHFMKMSGNEVFKQAVRIMAEAAQKAVSLCGLDCKDIACFIPHQANLRIIDATAKRLGLSKERIYLNIERYGNMSSASNAVGLVEAIKNGMVKDGDLVVMVAFGSGLTWGACVLKWQTKK